MASSKPIGIFDSGIGGLTVFKEIARTLPAENIVYFGDTARAPYGIKSKSTVTRFSLENTKFLLKFAVKMIVVACNTSSSLALSSLKWHFSVPIIGVIEPGVTTAVKCTENKRVGVIATPSTIESGIYERKLKSVNPEIRTLSRACPLFVPLVEEGWMGHRVSYAIAEEYLKPLKREGIDTLILGCTHYPLLKPVLNKVLGRKVRLVDSAEETARLVSRVLTEKRLRACAKKPKPNYRFYVSDEAARFIGVARSFLGKELKSVRKISYY